MFRLSRKSSSGGVTHLHLFKKPYIVFLYKVHLVGDKTSICENARWF
jgi:hypothetical protein